MLKFGTGGVPWSSKKRDVISGVKTLDTLGLDHLEIEFVQGVRMKKEKASEIAVEMQDLNIKRDKIGKVNFDMTIHGPYYVNLVSSDEKIISSSKEHILNSLRIGNVFGAKSVTFHSGFFQYNSKETATERVVTRMKEIKEIMDVENINVVVAPELTGKESQFGDLDGLVDLCQKVEGVRLCYDFAHAYARSVGKNNTESEVKESLKYIKQELGPEFLQNLHIHISNIIYSEKGERWHLPFLDSIESYKDQIPYAIENEVLLTKVYDEFYENGKKVFNDVFDWRMILRVFKEFEIGGWVVCESPLLEWDALLLQKYYNKL